MYSFKNKIALVTGSATGIGKSILTELANEGCIVIVHYFKNKNEALKTKNEIKKNIENVDVYSCDLTIEKNVKNLFNKIKIKYGKLDILVNNVGNYLKKPLEKLKPKEWNYIIDSNLQCTFYCMHYGLPLLRKSKEGRIINIGYASAGQITAKPMILPYQIAKTGILLMTKAYAVEEAKNNILVNMISPGVLENSIHLPVKNIPLKKLGSLKGFSKTVLNTISSDYITGANIEYAGGFNLI